MIGSGELIVILGVILVLFGGKKLPEFARNLGVGIREFKKACSGEVDTTEINLKDDTKKLPPTDEEPR
jgi:sec-independent protein translocase protein TatA